MRKNHAGTVVIVAVVVLIIAALVTGAYLIIKNQLTPPKELLLSGNSMQQGVTMEDMASRRYITDCSYSGPFDYPEVYDIPFQQTEEYVKNKDLEDEVKGPAVETAQAFFEALLDTSYRDIQEDPQAYSGNISIYSLQSVIMNGIYPVPDDDAYTVTDIAEKVGDYFVENQVEQEDDFITNESLVYGDTGSIWVRGALRNVIHSSKDPEVATEEEHLTFFDVMLEKSNNSPTGYAVAGIFKTVVIHEDELTED